jgi:excisionase family DNA binding protein
MSGERLNKTKEVAAYLGVSVKTIHRKIADGSIPHIYVGVHPRFKKEDIDNWVKKRTISTK